MWATPDGALATLDGLFGAIEQTAEYLYQRACHGGRDGRESDRGRGAVRAGGGGRPAAPRRPVRVGFGERSPRRR